MEAEKRHWVPKQFEVAKGTCLFCGHPMAVKGGRTKEHVIPRWLLRHFDIEGQQIEGSWMSAINNYKAKDIRPQVLGSLVQGSVCAACNGGWMSGLEAEVMPLLLSLAGGERSVDRLSNFERLLLARWCVKTCAALNHASNFHRLVRPEHAAAVEAGPPVTGTFVLGGQLDQDPAAPIYWNQTVGAGPMVKPADVSLEQILADLREGWRITLRIGRLILLTAYVPPGVWLPLLNPATHTLVWPLDTPIPVQAEKTPIERKRPEDELFFFNMELHMVHESLTGNYAAMRIPDDYPEADAASGGPAGFT